jgi:hypothetical protein
MKTMSALSLKQPNAEQVLRGKKKIEYRNMPTNKRERVYVYASMTPADQVAWDEIGLENRATFQLRDCRNGGGSRLSQGAREYEWHLGISDKG